MRRGSRKTDGMNPLIGDATTAPPSSYGTSVAVSSARSFGSPSPEGPSREGLVRRGAHGHGHGTGYEYGLVGDGGDGGGNGSLDDGGGRAANPGDNNRHLASIESILLEYSGACRLYGCADRMNAGVLTTFRFRLPTLRVSGSFVDADMLALAEVLLRHINGSLSHIRRLDFSLAARGGVRMYGGKRGIRSHGAYSLSQILRVSRYVEEVFLPGNRVGPYGASAIFLATAENPMLRTLHMRGCRIGEKGAWAFASHVLSSPEYASNLTEVDLSANRIGFPGCVAVEKAMEQRRRHRAAMEGCSSEGDVGGGGDGRPMVIDLEGNLVFQEIMNCVTHGLGVLLVMVGTFLLSKRVEGKPNYYVVSCAVYSASLVVLYLSSTLFHSFFALRGTKHIFKVFDLCAIYILIAGSYTPFLTITLHHKPIWSGNLLAFIWICSGGGIAVNAFFPLWKHKPTFSLCMYLGMGWSCMLAMGDLLDILPMGGIKLLVAGGLGYTLGVPFFVRNNNLDHSIWHMFVLAGSLFHWLCIYVYVVTLDAKDVESYVDS